jgi:UDP-2,3-diacylglucosamine pyrophosphatase LpxH
LLIIISDLHLVDGSSGKSITAGVFKLFADRVTELAISASWRSNGRYRPLESIDIILLGDILDPLHSTLWFETSRKHPEQVRPWSDSSSPAYSAKLSEITTSILKHNKDSLKILRYLSEGRIVRLPPADRRGRMAKNSEERIPISVRIHYMVGNHDWYYHLPGPQFDKIREDIISTFGLSNPITPFPHEVEESNVLQKLFSRYKLYAQHGDIYDPLNFDPDKGRDHATIGDAFTMELVNRFPVELDRQLGDKINPNFLTSLHDLYNVRPTLVAPLWISSQLRQNNVPDKEQKKIKEIWDAIGKDFLKLDIVRAADKRFKFDAVDAMQLLINLTSRTSFKTIDDIVFWAREKLWTGNVTFSEYALKEAAFLDRTAQFIVYGHTHRHEIVPLDSSPAIRKEATNQIYINSGTWHNYYDLAVFKPREQKFIPYQVLTYLAFFKDGQRGGRRFETWSGSFSE